MDSSGFDPTLSALAGIALGALVGGLLTYWFKRRDEKRERRAAARLVDEELANADFNAVMAIMGSWDLLAAEPISGEVWHEHQLLLARHLSFDEWDRLRSIYAEARHLRMMGLESNRRGWDATAKDQAQQLSEAVRRGRRVLDRYADAPPFDKRQSGRARIGIGPEPFGPPRP